MTADEFKKRERRRVESDKLCQRRQSREGFKKEIRALKAFENVNLQGIEPYLERLAGNQAQP